MIILWLWIECIEDLVALSKDINVSANWTQRYSGKYIVLTKDLDFNSIFSYSDYTTKYSLNSEKTAYIENEDSETTLKELLTDTSGQGFIPITKIGPSEDQSFQGNFDGRGHVISNLYIKNSNNVGLFGRCYKATIKNLTVKGNIVKTGTAAAGCRRNSRKHDRW